MLKESLRVVSNVEQKPSKSLTEEEGMAMVLLKNEIDSATKKERHALRRGLRYRIFRIREGRADFDGGLSKVLEAQFQANMTLENFTFDWDLSVNDPLKVITQLDWLSEGGTTEDIMGVDGQGRPALMKQCYPSAFTKQEM